MSVVGIDFGNSTCVVGRVGRRGADVLLNGSSNRKTPTVVSFHDRQRLMGEQAVPMMGSNYKNTVTNIKRILGLPFSSPQIQKEVGRLPFKVVEMEGDRTGIEVSYCGETRVFTPEAVLGAMFVDLRESARAAGMTGVADCVITVPGYYTDAQRQAVQAASRISGLHPLRLMNDLTAAALEYGIYKHARKEFDETVPKHVMFIDMGHTGFQVSVVAFVQGRLQVHAYAFDRDLGGRDFDLMLADKLSEQFLEKYGEDPRKHPKAMVKLMAAVEKARKTLSPVGVREARVSVECLVKEFDLHACITEDEFAEWSAPLVEKCVAPIQSALQQAGLAVDQLTSVEVIGGAIRMRCMKQRIAAVLGVQDPQPPNFGLSTTLNMDEAIARGAALMGAIMSPAFKVIDFSVVDRVTFPVRLSWEKSGMDIEGEDDDTSIVIFNAGDETPKIRRVTFRRTEAFQVSAAYADDALPLLPAGVGPDIGTFTVHAVPNAEGGDATPRIRVNVRHDVSGCFDVASVQYLKEKKEEPAPAPAPEAKEAAEGKDAAEGAGAGEAGAAEAKDATAEGAAGEAKAATAEDAAKPEGGDATPAADTPKAGAEAEAGEEKKKKRFTRVNLSFDASLSPITADHVAAAQAAEKAMQDQDAAMRRATERRNELESYVYSFRDRLVDDLSPYVKAAEKEAFNSAGDEIEDWLYSDEGESATIADYDAKLKHVKDIGDKALRRKTETEARPAAVTSLRQSLKQYRELAVAESRAHLTADDKASVEAFCKDVEDWLANMEKAQAAQPLTEDAVLTVADISTKKTVLKTSCDPIVNKPKPVEKKEEPKKDTQPEAAPADDAAKPETADAKPAGEGESKTGMDLEDDEEEQPEELD